MIRTIPTRVTGFTTLSSLSWSCVSYHHAHLAIHRGRDGQVVLAWHSIARVAIELAEAEVAVGDEGAHPEFVRQGEGAAVRVACALDVHGLSADGDIAKQPVHVGEMPALLVSLGQRERLRCQSHGAVDAILHELGFGQ